MSLHLHSLWRRILHPRRLRRALQRRARIPAATRQRLVNIERGYRLHGLAPLGHPGGFRRGDWAGLDFSDTDWSGEDFSHADLRATDFSRCAFKDADLTDARFWNATLVEADLSQARGLVPGHLAGADLTLARLPKDLEKFAALDYIKSISENSARVFLTLLALAAFMLLTIASAQDSQFFLNTASTRLPVIGIDIPILGFYVAAPLLLLLFHVYHQLYLQRLWDALAALPAVFPDGRRLDEATHPWLVNDLCRDRHPLLRRQRPRAARLQSFISVLLVWAMVPFVLWIVWANGLRAQLPLLTALHVALCTASLGFSLWFRRLMKHTFRARCFPRAALPPGRPRLTLLLGSLATLGCGLLLAGWSHGVFTAEDVPQRWTPMERFERELEWPFKEKNEADSAWARPWPRQGIEGSVWQRWGPQLLYSLRLKPYAEIGRLDFAGPARDQGVEMPGRHLHHLAARGASLTGASLLRTKMHHSDFTDAVFRAVVWDGVDARRACFDNAKFVQGPRGTTDRWQVVDLVLDRRKAAGDPTFLSCKFQKASFINAQMEKPEFAACEFDGALFAFATLAQANFNICTFEKTDFEWTDLRNATFSAETLLPVMNSRISNFKNAAFGRAQLRDVDFGYCDMTDATFFVASLEGADLSKAEGLTWKQLEAARCLRDLKLPTSMPAKPEDLAAEVRQRIKDDPSRFPEPGLPPVPRRAPEPPPPR